ncbi:GDP-L-fucose synthase family protein [Agaribacterium haliotis]|uniref:GDP-L-fucose synthase family protein n=1 Tax=Agaribacterium haliotis TaxID=2013869 RepID=UPI000BB57C73|nr:GDP-L-fucose synthase [Agaribacterium haliotis]
MKVFVTGGRGMVGRNVISLAKQHDFEICSPSSSELNLLDAQAIHDSIQQFRPDVVIHAAGKVGGIQANIQSPFDFFYDNLQMGINVVYAAWQNGVDKLINLGSSCMYPKNATNPLREDCVLSGDLEPTNEGYALAKLSVGRMCEYLYRQYGVEYKTIVPCNLYGLWDKFSPNNSHMVPAVIRKIHEASVSGSHDVEIWGDGKARREFMFAEDLADFILYAIRNYDHIPSFINAGVGIDHSIVEYYETIAKIIGFNGRFVHDLTKPSGMSQKLVDVSKQKELGWSPKTSLVDGIQLTYKHFLEEQI